MARTRPETSSDPQAKTTGTGRAATEVRLKTITSRLSARGASLVIEATEPVPYVATQPDPLTLLLDLRNVASDGVANRVPVSTSALIAGVELEAADSMGSPVSRIRGRHRGPSSA